MHARHQRTQSGFTLVELIIVIAVIGLLAAALVPSFSSVTQSGQVTATLEVVNTLKSACLKYKADCNRFAWEYSGYDAANRQLSGTQTVVGWKGPYIDQPITNSTCAIGTACHVYSYAYYCNTGFDLDGDNTIELAANSPANVLVIWGVTDSAAEELDKIIDKGVPGAWRTTGRVVSYAAGSVTVLLMR